VKDLEVINLKQTKNMIRNSKVAKTLDSLTKFQASKMRTPFLKVKNPTLYTVTKTQTSIIKQMDLAVISITNNQVYVGRMNIKINKIKKVKMMVIEIICNYF
jgi:hypothetical protein